MPRTKEGKRSLIPISAFKKMFMQFGTCLILSTVTGMGLLPAYNVQKAERHSVEMLPVHHRTDTSLYEVNYNNAT